TNDSFHALRAYIARPESARGPRRTHTGVVFRSRRTTPPTAQGRWSLVPLRERHMRQGFPQGLKPTSPPRMIGTAEAVPFQNGEHDGAEQTGRIQKSGQMGAERGVTLQNSAGPSATE